jgi:DNA-binding NarL/FixJ family response regulator
VRLGLRCRFSAHHAIREAGTEAEARRAALDPQVQVILLDLRWIDRDQSPVDDAGLRLLADIRAARPELPILMYSVEAGADCIARCRRLGASGYLVKGVDDALLTLAVRAVLAGGQIWPDPPQPRETARSQPGETVNGHARL